MAEEQQSPPPIPKDQGTTPWRTALLVGKQRTPAGIEKVMLIILRDDTLQIALFITPEQAEELAEQFMNTATQIRTGLVIPPKPSIAV